jgi:hypothetical protein
MVLRLVLLAAFLWTSVALAAEQGGSSGGGDVTPLEPPMRDRGTGNTNLGARGEPLGVFIDGRVLDGRGNPLPGIKAKLFSAGVLISTAESDAEGEFQISGNPPVTEERPIDLWFISPDSRWVDTSFSIDSNGKEKDPLRSACTPVIPLLGGSGSIEVRMLTLEERRAEIARSRCLEES